MPAPTASTARPAAPVRTVRAVPATTRAAPPADDGPMIHVQGLHKWYGPVHALQGVDLDVRPGEVMGFLGPNGAGKTTFTKCLLGFIRPTNGSIRLFGQDVRRDGRHILENVGLVPDQYDFYGNLNGFQHLHFYGRLYGIHRKELKARIAEVLQLVGMSDRAHRRVREYSHGMKQRLCIAQALLNRPHLIVFDEPTNGLDPKGAYEIRELIKGLSRQGTSVFLSSHILPEVEQVCSRVAILSKGKILAQAKISELRKKLTQGQAVLVTITLDNPTPAIERLPIQRGVALRSTLNGNELQCELKSEEDIAELTSLLVKSGARIRGVQQQVIGLEQIFLELTQGEGGL